MYVILGRGENNLANWFWHITRLVEAFVLGTVLPGSNRTVTGKYMGLLLFLLAWTGLIGFLVRFQEWLPLLVLESRSTITNDRIIDLLTILILLVAGWRMGRRYIKCEGAKTGIFF
jgi:hypothetical protein